MKTFLAVAALSALSLPAQAFFCGNHGGSHYAPMPFYGYQPNYPMMSPNYPMRAMPMPQYRMPAYSAPMMQTMPYATSPAPQSTLATPVSGNAGDKVAEKQIGNRTAYVDSKAMSLYTFANDVPGQSTCYGECAKSWPPYLLSDNAKAEAPFSAIQRKDGSQQWALNGKPLYTWVADQKPGDISGDGVGGNWALATK